jgi:hypothetical protein
MALDVGIELGGEKLPADLIAFQLGHVDAVGGKPAHRLVECSRDVADPEHEGRNHDLVGDRARRNIGLARQHHETRDIGLAVLDILSQDIEPVEIRGQPLGAKAAMVLSPLFETSLAAPAVSPATMAFQPLARTILRHCPSA